MQLVVLGTLVLATGIVLIWLARARRGSPAALLALVLVAWACAFGAVDRSSAQASTSTGCPVGTVGRDSLQIVQTSTMTGLSPDVGPAAIAGTVTNRGNKPVFVRAITVHVASVDAASAAAAGWCDSTDYVVRFPVMAVGRTLDPGDTATFRGATIGFQDKLTNQDACQRAMVNLIYLSS